MVLYCCTHCVPCLSSAVPLQAQDRAQTVDPLSDLGRYRQRHGRWRPPCPARLSPEGIAIHCTSCANPHNPNPNPSPLWLTHRSPLTTPHAPHMHHGKCEREASPLWLTHRSPLTTPHAPHMHSTTRSVSRALTRPQPRRLKIEREPKGEIAFGGREIVDHPGPGSMCSCFQCL